MTKSILFLFASLLLFSSSAIAQRPATDDEKIPKSRLQRHEDFKAQKSDFPAKPRNMWEIGISAGVVQVSGDVKNNWTAKGKDHLPAFGYGLTVRKALGYVMSLRAEYFRGNAYGQNWQPSSGIDRNPVLNGKNDPNLNYSNNPGYVFHNYKTTVNDLALEALFTLNNIKYHKEQNRIGINAIVGIGIGTYETYIDQLDANGAMYNYDVPFNIGGGLIDNSKDILNELATIYDSEYETAAEGQPSNPTLFERNYKPVVTGGLGFHFMLSNRISLALEHKVKFTNDDLVDGQRWEETNTLTREFDAYHYSSLHLNFNLGKIEKNDIPSWWVNPLSYSYQELTNSLPPDLSDDDADGVLNILDQEPNTPPDYPVDTRGVTLDSDKDGCPDFSDPEPYSTPELAIQNCVNVGAGSDIDESDVRRIVQEMLGDQAISAGGSDWYLPMIHYDLDKDFIKTEFYPELKHIADVMSRYPKLKVEVIGYTDTRNSEEYNLDLSQRRAGNAINHIVDRYGIAADRFIMRFEGENSNLVPDANREGDHYMNRRVEFRAVIEN
ncbi:MAG: OOP family OmpA-OmpF porin [Limisphaerales bacterium]|jgi:OOP family OmpA-OmpF porin